METDFVDSHNVCSRFYIQMSSSQSNPSGSSHFVQKVNFLSAGSESEIDFDMWVTREFCFVGLLNFSSDQSFYTNSASNAFVLLFLMLMVN